MEQKKESCATCRFYCQDVDPESRLYYDNKSGECRRSPPTGHFLWQKTRPYHWCGEWQQKQGRNTAVWHKLSQHPFDDRAVLLYRSGLFCRQSGMIVGYWNDAFKKWHDDGDRLFDREEFSDWIELPDPPQL